MSTSDMASMDAGDNDGMRETRIFGVPIGRLGFLSRVLISGACGFIVFLGTFFLAIVGVSIYDTATGRSIQNLNIAYLYFAAPAGILALVGSFGYLMILLARRKTSPAA